jgi:nitroreductase
MNVSVLHAIQQRHSSRLGFEVGRSVSESDLQKMLEAAQAAPTFANAQDFELVVVDNPQMLRQICELPGDISKEYVHANFEHVHFQAELGAEQRIGLLAHDSAAEQLSDGQWSSRKNLSQQLSMLGLQLDSHQTLIFGVSDLNRYRTGSTAERLTLMSLGCVIENLWLAAEAIGLGFNMLTILCDGPTQHRLKPILHLPAAMEIAFVCAVGYPKQVESRKTARRTLEEFVHRGVYPSAAQTAA